MTEDLTCNETMPAGDDPDALRRFHPQQSTSQQTSVQSVFTSSSLQRLGLQNNTHPPANSSVGANSTRIQAQPTDLSRFRRTPSTSIRPEAPPANSFTARLATYSNANVPSTTTNSSNTQYLIRNANLSGGATGITSQNLFSNIMQHTTQQAISSQQFQSPTNRYVSITTAGSTITSNAISLNQPQHSSSQSQPSGHGQVQAASFRSVVQTTPRPNSLIRPSVTPTPATTLQPLASSQTSQQTSVINHSYASILSQPQASQQTSHIVNSIGNQVLGTSTNNPLLRQSFTPKTELQLPQTSSQPTQIITQQKVVVSNPQTIRSVTGLPTAGRTLDTSFLANHILGRAHLGLNDVGFQNSAQSLLSSYIMPNQTRIEALYRPQVKETIQSGSTSGHATPPATSASAVNSSPSKPSILRRKNDTNGSPVKRLVDREITRPASVSGLVSSSPNFMENTGRQTASVLPDPAAISDDSQQYGGTSMMFGSGSVEELRSDDSPRKRMRKQQFEAPSINDKLKMEVNLKPPEIPIWRAGAEQIIGPDGQTILTQSSSTPRPFDSPGKEPKKRGRPRKIHTPLPDHQQGYPIGGVPNSSAMQYPDSGTRSVMVDMGPILNPTGMKKRKYTKRPKEIDPLTGEPIKKPRKEGSGRKKKPQEQASDQQINDVVNAVHMQLAKYKVEEEQRARELAAQQARQVQVQQAQNSADRDRGAQTLVLMQNMARARAQEVEKVEEKASITDHAGPSYVQTDLKNLTIEQQVMNNVEIIHRQLQERTRQEYHEVVHMGSAKTKASHPHHHQEPHPAMVSTITTTTTTTIKEEIVETIKTEPMETDEAAREIKTVEIEEVDSEIQILAETKEKTPVKAKKPMPKVTSKTKKHVENLSDFESDSESMPGFLLDELQNLLEPCPRPISPMVPGCSMTFAHVTIPISDKVTINKPKAHLNDLQLDYNPRGAHFKTFSDFRKTCDKIRAIPITCNQWSTANKRVNKLKEKIKLLRSWKVLKEAQEKFKEKHPTFDISKLSLDGALVEPLDIYEPPGSLVHFYEDMARLERRQGHRSIIPPSRSVAGDSDLLDVYETVSDIIETVSSMNEPTSRPNIVDFEERDVFGMPTTPLFIALGEESTEHSKIPRSFYNVVMPKLRLRRVKNRRKKTSTARADDEIDMGDSAPDFSSTGEPETKSEIEDEARKRSKFELSKSDDKLDKLEDMFKQAMSLHERISMRKSETLANELTHRLVEVSTQLKQMRSWTEEFVQKLQPETYTKWVEKLDCIQGSCPSDTDQLKYDQMTALFLEIPPLKSCFKTRKNYDCNGGVTINPSTQMINFLLQAKSPYFKSNDLTDLSKLEGVTGVKNAINDVTSHAITQIKRFEQDYMNVDDLECLCNPYSCAKALAGLIKKFSADEFREMATYDLFDASERKQEEEEENVPNLVEEFIISGQNPMKNRDIPSREVIERLPEKRRKGLIRETIHHTREMAACILQSMHERSSIMKQCHDALEEAFINIINNPPPPTPDEFDFVSDSENHISDDSDVDDFNSSTSSKPVFKKKYKTKKSSTPGFKKPLPARGGIKYKKRGAKT